ncbi:hypothetical protein XA68_18349 [Ophiocordyceps unilateralis]|uniref:HhH-GPD domain-containing protein n=1 Tax=Ophiocordyceps unilateralis TaxID=268505 RepID=A0A2A9P252_OPHUN|nr:hypothetical protein XA68_18349 [Ophiocordyceps unilateralis]
MACSPYQDVFFFFDVREESRDFLCHVFQSSAAPRNETQWLLHQSLLAGADDWNALIDCARSIRRSRPHDALALDGQDDLSYVWSALFGLGGSAATATRDAWEETDRLIALARKLEKDADVLLRSMPACKSSDHFLEPREHLSGKRRRSIGGSHLGLSSYSSRPTKMALATTLWSSRSTSSPYFLSQPPDRDSPRRPLAGTVSCIRFPPLSNLRFGIVQEEMAHDPFWLLIAVTFLIKTSGQLAIPALYKVMRRFPTPAQLCDPANTQQLSDMIRHLGLGVVRVAMIHRYARAFLDRPPRAGVRFRVRNYEKRDVAALWDQPPTKGPDEVLVDEADSDDDEAWEIGHMTQGRYALDSWRIFCRDVLLGRADDWNGKGREAEFQPEWMRVLPADKELRACLRWMWMREGWEWDPATGGRTVLREEMRRAVDEGRVEYDETGGLRIMGEARIGGGRGGQGQRTVMESISDAQRIAQEGG